MGMENIFRCADEMNFAPELNLGSDFFAADLVVPQEIVPSPEQNAGPPATMDTGMLLTPAAPKKQTDAVIGAHNWRQCVNRAFMAGLTAEDILKSIGDEILKLPDSAEILAYIKKYEGLMGTVFLDISVLESGFPYARIPERFAPFHRFAIGCRNRRKVRSRAFVGRTSGDIDDFLNSEERLEEVSGDVCALTGLPVYKSGMFTQKLIDELLKLLGAEKGDLSRLQNLLREKVLGIRPAVSPASDVAESDLDFGLTETRLDVPVADAASLDGFRLERRASVSSDIDFEEIADAPMAVTLDGELRF